MQIGSSLIKPTHPAQGRKLQFVEEGVKGGGSGIINNSMHESVCKLSNLGKIELSETSFNFNIYKLFTTGHCSTFNCW